MAKSTNRNPLGRVFIERGAWTVFLFGLFYWTCGQLKDQIRYGSTAAYASTWNGPALANGELSRLSAANCWESCSARGIRNACALHAIIIGMSRKRIMYSSRNLSDCSGIYHRVMGELKSRFPEMSIPEPKTVRNSRQIARWYDDQRQFVSIEDPLAQSHLIRPGAVLFFGRKPRVNQKPALKQALSEIRHMGIVVSVSYDEAGNLISYEMFHARSPGRAAGITNEHFRAPTRNGATPFGNWTQHLVGMAPLISS